MVPGEPGEAFGTLGGVLGEHRKVIGSTWEVPGELLGDPGGVFGAAFRGFGGDFQRTAAEKVARVNRTHGFGHKKGAKREAQGTYFGSQNRYKIASKIGCDSADVLWCSWAPLEARKLHFHWRVV